MPYNIDISSNGASEAEARMQAAESMEWLQNLAPSIVAKVKELLHAEPKEPT